MIRNIEAQLKEILDELNSNLNNYDYFFHKFSFETKFFKDGKLIGWGEGDGIPVYTLSIYLGNCLPDKRDFVTEIEIEQKLLDSLFYNIILDKDYIKRNILNFLEKKNKKLNETIAYINGLI